MERPLLKGVVTSAQIREEMASRGIPKIPEGLEYVDENNPELGFKLRHPNRNRYIPEYEHKLGEMSLTDGVPIPREAPPPRRANFGSIERFIEDREVPGGPGWPE